MQLNFDQILLQPEQNLLLKEHGLGSVRGADGRTHFDNYQKLGVPELWRYDGKTLEINVLKEGRYVVSTTIPCRKGHKVRLWLLILLDGKPA